MLSAFILLNSCNFPQAYDYIEYFSGEGRVSAALWKAGPALFIYIYTDINIPIYLPTYLSIYLSACLSIYLSIYLSFFLSIYLSLKYIYINHMHIIKNCTCIHVHMYKNTHIYIYVCVCGKI